MRLLLICFLFIGSNQAFAQIQEGSKVFLTFENVEGEVNVNGEDAKAMLVDYLKNRTTLLLVDEPGTAEFVFKLNVVEKNMGNRRGRLTIEENASSNVLFESRWMRGTMNAFYGYSGSRHAIGRLTKDALLEQYPHIEKK
jgi:hypothetical protein